MPIEPEMRPEKEARFNQRRELIIRRAAEVFGRKGFHATILDDIAAKLDVTKASLYYYFSTKEDLLYAVLQMAMRDHLDRIDRVLGENPDASPAKKLELAIAQHLQLLAEKYEGAFLLQQEYELEGTHREEIIELRREYEQRFVDIVQEGVQQHVFRVRDERVAVLMILGSINWFLRWFRSDGRFTVDEIARVFADLILHGLLVNSSSAEPAG